MSGDRLFRLYQIELSSYCNLRCQYCPHPSMQRSKGFMSEVTMQACIDWALRTRTPRLVLHHFGEPLLHPQLLERLTQIASAGLTIQFSTNALLLDRSWDTLLDIDTPITAMIAFHQWVDTSPAHYLAAVAAYQQRAEGTNITVLPAYAFKNDLFHIHSWGSGSPEPWDVLSCPFLKYNLGVILWNGDIVSCCVDHEGVTASKNIRSVEAFEHRSLPWVACETCDVGRLMKDEVY